MKKFESTAELAEAYQKKFNAGYADEDKHFSIQDVIDICFEYIPAISFNRLYGTKENPGIITMISGFGYVVGKKAK